MSFISYTSFNFVGTFYQTCGGQHNITDRCIKVIISCHTNLYESLTLIRLDDITEQLKGRFEPEGGGGGKANQKKGNDF